MAARRDPDWSGGWSRFGPVRMPTPRRPELVPSAAVPERRHVADGFTVEIRTGAPARSLSDQAGRDRHILTCSIPSARPCGTGAAQVPADMAFVPAGGSWEPVAGALADRHLCLLLQTDFVDEILPGADADPGFVARSAIDGERLRHVLDRLAVELETPGFASDMLVQSLCLAAVIELNRCLMAEYAAEARPANACQDRVLSLVESRLRTSLEQPVSLEHLAEECGIGVRHLSRLFRQATGTTIGHTLAKARIDQAKRLLSQTSVMIKEVSWRCGFREQAAFTTAFRKATGQSPSAYRSAVRTRE